MATSIDDNAADGKTGKLFSEMSMIQYTSVTTHLYLSNFFFITASFHDILKETAVITYGKTKKIYYQAQ